MKINILVNDHFYKSKDLGPVRGYNLAAITEEIRQDYKQNLLAAVADGPDYKLTVLVVG